GVRSEYGTSARRALALRLTRVRQLALVVILTFPLAILNAEVAQQAARALGRPPVTATNNALAPELAPDRLAVNPFEKLDRLYDAQFKLPWFWALLFAAVLPAVGEELLCRGLIGRGLVARYGPVVGVLLTSLLFGLLHIDPVRMAAATILGIALHAVYLATRSLLASMLLHASINAVCISAFKVWTAHQLNILGHF